MLKTENHIRNTKHILLMWVVLFSLSPCIVKEALFSSASVGYAKPLNKSKTTAPTNSCQYSLNENQQVSVVKQSKINKQIEPTDFSEKRLFVIRSTKIHGNYSKTFSGNGPPKYILYKRLKLDVA